MANKTNCVINGKEYYRIRKKVGEDINGKPITKPFYGKNKTDAERMIRDYELNRKAGIKNDKEYFGKLFHYWVYEVFMKGNHASGTKIRYEGIYRNYIQDSELSNYLMSEINSKLVQQYFNVLKETKTDSQINAVKKVFALFFKYVDAEGYCRNPMQNIAIQKNDPVQKEIVIFNKDDRKRIMESPLNSSIYRTMFILGLGSGLRQGELLGLKYGDIKDGRIKVMRQITTDVDKTRKEDNTKSKYSVRYVPIKDDVLSELERYKDIQENAKDTDYIFCTASGKLIDKSNIITSWKRFLKRIGVEYKEFHTLRRTYCTMLCENGVPLQVASNLMGHKDVSVTAQYYTFISDKEKEDAAQKIADALMGKSSKAKKGLKRPKRLKKH